MSNSLMIEMNRKCVYFIGVLYEKYICKGSSHEMCLVIFHRKFYSAESKVLYVIPGIID